MKKRKKVIVFCFFATWFSIFWLDNLRFHLFTLPLEILFSRFWSACFCDFLLTQQNIKTNGITSNTSLDAAS